MTTGAAATSRCVRKYTAAATQNSIMQTKNTRRPSRPRSRRARTTRRAIDDLREAVTTLKETERTARRVLGSEHPFVKRTVANSLRGALIALHALEKPSGSA